LRFSHSCVDSCLLRCYTVLTGKWFPRTVFEDCLIRQLRTIRSFITPLTVTTPSCLSSQKTSKLHNSELLKSLSLFISKIITVLSVWEGAAISHDIQSLCPLVFFYCVCWRGLLKIQRQVCCLVSFHPTSLCKSGMIA